MRQPETRLTSEATKFLHRAWSYLPPNCRTAILILADLPISDIQQHGLKRLLDAWDSLPPDLAGKIIALIEMFSL